VDLTHHLAWNAAWNYYQYGEKSFVGAPAPRYFHANNATVALRYESEPCILLSGPAAVLAAAGRACPKSL